MTEQLGQLLVAFNGDYSRTRCFLHILNLVAKSMLRQFDVKAVSDVEEVDVDVQKLLKLAEGLEAEEAAVRDEQDVPGEDGVDDDDEESWIDEVGTMNDEEQDEFEREVRPVKMVLVKVSRCVACHVNKVQTLLRRQIRRLAFKIVHSTTVVKPLWESILAERKLPNRLIPRDVKTRWNSTYDMLQVALEYREAVDELCSSRDHGVRPFELTAQEWTIAQELCETLKVRPLRLSRLI